MKRLFPLFLTVALLLSGCASNKSIDIVTENFNFTAEFTKGKETAKYFVTVNKKGNFTVNQLSNGKGNTLKYTFDGDNVTVSYGNLEHTLTKAALQKGNFIDLLPEIYGQIKKTNCKAADKNNDFTVSVKTDSYDALLHLGQSGLPIKLTEENYKINVEFKNPGIIS